MTSTSRHAGDALGPHGALAGRDRLALARVHPPVRDLFRKPASGAVGEDLVFRTSRTRSEPSRAETRSNKLPELGDAPRGRLGSP